MSLRNLYLSLVVFIFTLATASYIYYTSWREEVQSRYSVPFIPKTAALVYEVDAVGRQWDQFQQTTLSKDLAVLPLYVNIQTSLQWLEDIGIGQPTLEELPMTVSIHGLGEDEPGYIFYFPLHHRSTQELGDLLLELKQNPDYQIEEHPYSNKHKITSVKKASNPHSLHFTKQGSYLILAPSLLLLEDIIRGLIQKDSDAFLPLTSLPSKPGSLYVNFANLPSLLRILFKSKATQTWEPIIAHFASAAQLELKLTNNHILLNGFVNDLNSIQDQQIHTMSGQGSGPVDLAAYIPRSTAWVQHIHFKDAQMLADTWKKYRRQVATTDTVAADSLGTVLHPLLNEEMGLCSLGSATQGQVLFLKTQHTDAFITALEEAKLAQKTLYYLPKRTSIPVYTVAAHVLRDWLPGYLFPWFQPRFLTTLDHYLVLADSKAALEGFIKQYNQGHTWANSPAQKEFLGTLLDQAHYSVLVNLQQAWLLLAQALKPHWKAIFDKHEPSLKNFIQASLQVVPDQKNTNNHYLSLVVEHTGNSKKAISIQEDHTIPTLQQFRADAPIITRPFIVPTHKPDGTLIIFQDALNQVYCIDKKGKLLWKNTLKTPIAGNIFVVDFYKNNRYQYLWITHDAIHLTDYYGRPVGNYPQPLPTKGTSFSLQVVDYQQDKNYRFLLADDQGNIYLKDSHYRPLPGWNPYALGHAFASTPFHIRLKNDYFLILQDNGLLKAVGRNKQSFSGFPIDLKAPIHNPLIVKKGSMASNTSLITLTDRGLLSQHNLVGTLQDSTQLEAPTTSTRFILCANEANNQGYTIVRQDLDKFAFMDEGGQLLFEKEYQAAQPLLYQYTDFGTHQFYIVTDPGQHLTYIYDRQGQSIHTAPLRNSQPVTLSYNQANSQLMVYSSFQDQTIQYLLESVYIKIANQSD
jgi:hypothetical protein